MKKLFAVLAIAAGALFLGSAPASAAGELCYDVNVTIADQAPITQAGCQQLP